MEQEKRQKEAVDKNAYVLLNIRLSWGVRAINLMSWIQKSSKISK
jgi:hypothetical protein